MPRARILFLLFFVSGWCGLLYQIVWVRLAFAEFGVITPVLSVVISVFMAGLSLGSWLGGRFIERWTASTGRSAIVFYGLAEVGIGIGAFTVPTLLAAGEALVRPVGAMASVQYLVVSGVVLTLALLPWCFFMGVTYPFMTAFIKEHGVRDESSFSYLYLANVAGALAGVLTTTLVLIELFGFDRSLQVAGALNFGIGLVAFTLRKDPAFEAGQPAAQAPARPAAPLPFATPMVFALLFGTGFVSMAMEVVWTRAFTPILNTTIYAFASLLGVYLVSTFLGTALYRGLLARGRTIPYDVMLGFLAGAAVLPLWLPDPRLAPYPAVALGSIVPFCLGLGYLTPRLVDEYGRGNPDTMGRGYAYNILGSILGPLCAGYLLLPWLGSKGALLLLAAPFLAFALLALRGVSGRAVGATLTAASVALFGWCGLRSATFDDGSLYEGAEVRRDHTATVISTHQDGKPALLVNGIGITVWTPITKMMAHLPLAARDEPAEEALVICFGMGTTVRSIASWDVPVTAVELVPSVLEAFGFYFDDADRVLARPDVNVVIDDGRRFLKRTDQRFDVVTIDPPPPPETAGSSLLYSVEFYELLKSRMTEDGILAQWFPGAEPTSLTAVTRAIKRAFPHVRIYRSFEGWGFHFLASQQPLPPLNAQRLLANLPAGARADLAEWVPEDQVDRLFQTTMALELPAQVIFAQKIAPALSDDRPINEYYLLRATFGDGDWRQGR